MPALVEVRERKTVELKQNRFGIVPAPVGIEPCPCGSRRERVGETQIPFAPGLDVKEVARGLAEVIASRFGLG